jgi:serine/threonine-protein kinase
VYERPRQADDGELWSIPADGSVSTPTRVSSGHHYHPHGWSADGRDLLVAHMQGRNADIVALPSGNSGEPRPVVATPAVEGLSGASLSPDGRWLAYAANPTGTEEIWVRPYPGPGAPVRVSPDGGTEPVWSRDGRTLFYRDGNRMLSVAVRTSAELDFAPPALIFEAGYVRGSQPPSYDVASDGRFLMLKRPAGSEPGTQPHIVVVNWAAELDR